MFKSGATLCLLMSTTTTKSNISKYFKRILKRPIHSRLILSQSPSLYLSHPRSFSFSLSITSSLSLLLSIYLILFHLHSPSPNLSSPFQSHFLLSPFLSLHLFIYYFHPFSFSLFLQTYLLVLLSSSFFFFLPTHYHIFLFLSSSSHLALLISFYLSPLSPVNIHFSVSLFSPISSLSPPSQNHILFTLPLPLFKPKFSHSLPNPISIARIIV